MSLTCITNTTGKHPSHTLRWLTFARAVSIPSVGAIAIYITDALILGPTPSVPSDPGSGKPIEAAAHPVTISRGIESQPLSQGELSKPFVYAKIANLPEPVSPLARWSRTLMPGDTLDEMLTEAGLVGRDRTAAILGLGAEYDLRRLGPGYEVAVETQADGTPHRVELTVEDGIQIEVLFGQRLSTRMIAPRSEMVILARETRIKSSLFKAFDRLDLPVRFAVDIAQMLGGTIDFRRDFRGGETLRVLWRETRVGDRTVGEPEITFVSLKVGNELYEVVWPEDGSGLAKIFRDGEIIRVFAQPVKGAQLSSVFGRRKHPIYGDVRLHTGIDFAASQGTPVHATVPGRITYLGRRDGYGRVVEVAHGSNTMTRYAHLSEIPTDLRVGSRIDSGDVIGNVGATGTTTGPNLHYEILVNGEPTDPLNDDRLTRIITTVENSEAVLASLYTARRILNDRLIAQRADSTNKKS